MLCVSEETSDSFQNVELPGSLYKITVAVFRKGAFNVGMSQWYDAIDADLPPLLTIVRKVYSWDVAVLPSATTPPVVLSRAIEVRY